MLQAGGNGSPPSVSEGAGRINHTDFRTGRALSESTLFSASPQRSWSLNPPPCAGLRVAFLNVVNGPPLFPFQRLKTKYSSELGTQPHLGVLTGLRTYSPKARDARRPSTHSCPASSDPHPLWRTVGGRSCRALLAALGGEGRSQRRPGQGSEGVGTLWPRSRWCRSGREQRPLWSADVLPSSPGSEGAMAESPTEDKTLFH